MATDRWASLPISRVAIYLLVPYYLRWYSAYLHPDNLPETCRRIVGNGSLPAQRWNVSFLTYVRQRRQSKSSMNGQMETRNSFKKRPNPLNTIYIIMDKESGIVLLYAAFLFSGFYMVITSLPSQLQSKYGFNEVQIGLCYLPTGFGSMAAALCVGRFLNWNFARHAKIHGLEITKGRQQDLKNFPIEVARLQVVLPLVFCACVTVVAYGWVLTAHTNLAGPLILLFVSTFCMSGSFQGLSTLVIDLNRNSPGTATAAMNMARCWLGAGAVAMVQPMLKAIGLGWVTVFVAGVWILMSPVVLIVMRGPRWRTEKMEREAKKEKEAARIGATGLEEGRK